ncbi:MAG: metal-dependent hydrolase [Tissierellales bacterium]|nr:metal-dependent hydrolase [Tissierellales bacterium]MBN2827439.1 metal-dependent hydrolase [Tissierellales bacterium]
MKITYLGHSVFLLEEGAFKAIIDPFIRGNKSCPITIENLTNLSHIFITHGHSDHIGDAVELADNSGALVVANAEIGRYLASKGVKRIHTMHIGGRHQFDFGVVKMTAAVHGSGIMEGDQVIEGGNPGGFVIEVKGTKIYHAGDTGLTYDMKLLEDEKIDIAMIPIGGNYTMDVPDAVRAVSFIKPKAVIPMHYNTFPAIEASPEEFKKKIKNAEVFILEINEMMEIDSL